MSLYQHFSIAAQTLSMKIPAVSMMTPKVRMFITISSWAGSIPRDKLCSVGEYLWDI